MDAFTPRPRPAFVAGSPEEAGSTFPVTHPYDGTEIATVSLPGAEQVRRALNGAVDAAAELAHVPGEDRARVLEGVASALAARAEELAELVTAESGTPIRWATAELSDAISVCRSAAHKAPLAGKVLSQGPPNPPLAGSWLPWGSPAPRTPGVSTGAPLAGERWSPGPPGSPLAGERLTSISPLAGERRYGAEPVAGVTLVRRTPTAPLLVHLDAGAPLGSAVPLAATALAIGTPVVLAPSVRAPLAALAFGELLAESDLPTRSFSVLPTDGCIDDDRFATVPHDVHRGTVAVFPDWPDLDDGARRIAEACVRTAPAVVRRVVVADEIAADFVPRLVDAVAAQPKGDPYDTEVTVACSREPSVRTDVAADDWHRPLPTEPELLVSTAKSPDEAFDLLDGPWASVFTRDLGHATSAAERIEAGTTVVGTLPYRLPGTVEDIAAALTAERRTVLAPER